MSRRASIPIEEDPKKKWKNLHENYDDHHNRKLFSHVHRGDLASTNRLLGYNDAMMATCATFLVVPIKHSKMKKAEELGQFLESIKVEVLMFFIGFFLVATIWESTNIRCIVVKRLDDLLCSSFHSADADNSFLAIFYCSSRKFSGKFDNCVKYQHHLGIS